MPIQDGVVAMIRELPLTTAEEYELVNKCISGDLNARDRLVLSCERIYVSQAIKWSRFCKMDVDDLASEFRMQTMKAAPMMKWKSDDYEFRLFVYGVCRWKAYKIARMQKSRIHIIDPDYPVGDPPVSVYRDYKEEFEEIKNFLSVIPEEARAYFLGRFDLDGMEVHEMTILAKQSNITENKYQYWVKRSINILKDHIRGLHDDWGFDLTPNVRKSRARQFTPV